MVSKIGGNVLSILLISSLLGSLGPSYIVRINIPLVLLFSSFSNPNYSWEVHPMDFLNSSWESIISQLVS